MKQILFGLTALCIVCIAGCSDDGGERGRWTGDDSHADSGWVPSSLFDVAADEPKEAAPSKAPNRPLAQAPAAKPQAPVAEVPAPVRPEKANHRAEAPQKTVQRNPVPIVQRNDVAQEQPRAAEAPRPAARKPRRKHVAGIDWHVSLPAALKEASAAPNGGKPVLCFRVLGDLTGFM